MVGKWHLGLEEDSDDQTVFPRGWWPIDRGFKQSYGMLEGGGEHFGSCERAEGHCTRFFVNDTIITSNLSKDGFLPAPPGGDAPSTYFSAQAHTNKALQFIDEGRAADGEQRKPFFLYFSDTMAHEPNQVPDEFIKQEYVDMYYQQGWDGMRPQRLQRMKDLGIIPADVPLRDRYSTIPDWNDPNDPNWQPWINQVTQPPYDVIWNDTEWTIQTNEITGTVNNLKMVLAKKYAAYIGMIEYFDHEVGRLVQHLQSIGEYDNTVFIFFSDNGGDGRDWDWVDRHYLLQRGVDNSLDNIGRRGSFVANGPGWAQLANTPLYGDKITVAQGGIRAPLVVTHPGGNIGAGTSSDTLLTVQDIAPTVLAYANVPHPVGVGVAPNWDSCTGSYNGDVTGVSLTNICPMDGKSIKDLVEGNAPQVHAGEPIGVELFGGGIGGPNKGLLLEDADGTLWKILKMGVVGFGAGPNEPWKLFNLTVDPSESNDLSDEQPDRFLQMIAMYNQYEQNVGYISTNAAIVEDATAGTSVPHTFDITNNDSMSDTFTLTCQSGWDCTLEEVRATSALSMTITLDAGASAQVRAMVSVPANAADGESNTTQINVIRTNNPGLSMNLTAVTTVAGGPTSVSQTSFTGGTPINRDWLLAITTLLLIGAVLKLAQISGHTLWHRD